MIDRNNFLFANTPGGAQGSAFIFSLIKTAKDNGIDPYAYLLHVLKTVPANGSEAERAEAASLERIAQKVIQPIMARRTMLFAPCVCLDFGRMTLVGLTVTNLN